MAPAAAALLDTDVAILPFWALSEMPFTMRTIAMLYWRRVSSSDAPPPSLLCWSLNTKMQPPLNQRHFKGTLALTLLLKCQTPGC